MSRPVTPQRPPQSECRLVVVQDQLQPCPYRQGVTARMPLRLPVGTVTPEVTDRLLELGFRRSGDFVYQPQCPDCQECRPTRIGVEQFRLTKSMRRVIRRGDRELVSVWQPPQIDENRVRLFNEHREQRGLALRDDPVDSSAYRSFLVDSCCDSLEMSMHLGAELLGISIVDVGRRATSAVYTHFSPAAAKYSLGTYAILKLIEWTRQTGRHHVYLGMYVHDNPHLNYKSRFRPQEQLREDRWRTWSPETGVEREQP